MLGLKNGTCLKYLPKEKQKLSLAAKKKREREKIGQDFLDILYYNPWSGGGETPPTTNKRIVNPGLIYSKRNFDCLG